jgi:PAS domain S-box-containing protein
MRAWSPPAPTASDAVGLLQRIAVLANEASTLAEACPRALAEICAHTGWPVGHTYVLDRADPGRLRSTDLWHLPPGRFEAFREVTETTPLRVGAGLPGRVLQSGLPEWTTDARTDPNFPRAATGRDIEVRAGFAVPVLAGRDAVAVLEFFTDAPAPRDDALLELMAHVGTQLGRVAERERAAADLVDQLDYTRALISSAHNGFVAIDEDGLITGWNAASETMFGWTAEEAVGRPLADTIIPGRYRAQHRAGIERFRRTRESHVLNERIEVTALRRDGSEFPVELAIWPVHTGGRTTFCAFVTDITPRHDMLADLRHADEQFRLSERRLIAAQEMAGVGSWEWDIDSGVVTWSEQLYRNFGVDPASYEPSFDAYMGLCHPEDRPFVLETVTRALNECGTFEIEHRSISPSDDEVRVHHCTGRVIVADGRPARMAGTNQDVTQQRRSAQAVADALEREKRMVTRLTELDEAKTRFVSSVSHELRTPLTSILGYLQFLQEAATELATEHKEMLGVIDRNSHRLLSLIEDLLTQSRIESGTFKLVLKPTDIAHVVEDVLEVMLPQAKERALELKACIEPDIGHVMGDEEQLERLLLNLVCNSLKFTHSGGVSVSARRTGAEVVLTVTDTGVGIPPDEVPDLFRPFFRSSNADNIAPGTGLGLTIVKAIVDEHHGTIDVASRQSSDDAGGGTMITIRLPAAAA